MKLNSLRLSAFALGLISSGFASAETYIVDRYQDDNDKGSLRWAIEQSNANTAQENQILIQAVGKAPYVIKVDKPL
ncbi:hypothetical protein KZ299_25450, partial [Escherichia coli]